MRIILIELKNITSEDLLENTKQIINEADSFGDIIKRAINNKILFNNVLNMI